MNALPQMMVTVCGSFDDIRSRHLRFLEEAARHGQLSVLVWPDELVRRITGAEPKFPLTERLYFLNAVRYVTRAVPLRSQDPSAPSCADVNAWPVRDGSRPQVWVDHEAEASDLRAAYCRQQGLEYRVLPASQMDGFPDPPPNPSPPGRPKVIVTGCYDWFHSGHVRFMEEVSAYGDLYVVVGHDANIRLLKGAGHPLHGEAERRYVAGSIKYVKQALISSGDGWLDADPEIRRLRPDVYAVNEDGDKGGKREYCERMGIQYLVLKRDPAPGLPRRTSTDLRGF